MTLRHMFTQWQSMPSCHRRHLFAQAVGCFGGVPGVRAFQDLLQDVVAIPCKGLATIKHITMPEPNAFILLRHADCAFAPDANETDND